MVKIDSSPLEPDILELFTRQIVAMAPEFEAAIMAQKAQFCEQYGGQRYFIRKTTRRYLTPEEYKAVYKDALTTMDDAEILKKHKISRTTLFRAIKGGGGRFS